MVKKGGKISIGNLKNILNDSYTKTGNDINDYKIDRDLTDDTIKVYKNDKTNEVVVAPKGTSSLGDVATDVKIFAGIKDKRFLSAKEKLDKVKAKYPDSKIDLVGHSLAGKVVEEIGGNDDRVNNIITLNKPTTAFDIITGRKGIAKQIDIRSKNDMVSLLKPFGTKNQNDIVIEPTSSNPLTEHKIEKLNDLNQDEIIGNGLDNLSIKELKIILKQIKQKNKQKSIKISGLKKSQIISLISSHQ
jgi:hypothetical protein